MQKPIDVVMVTWYRPKITEMMLEAIRQNTNRENYRLIVIDNNSPEDMQEMLQRYQDEGVIDNLILNEFNQGLEPARNQGLAEVESEFFICADNDCLPPKPVDGRDWIERLLDLINTYLDYAAISCRTQVMIGTGNIFELTDMNGDEVTEFPHPGGSLRIMRTDLVKKTGGWRNHVEGRGTEERYICGRLRELGYKTGFATGIHTLHLFGTRGAQDKTDRWGYPPDWEPGETGHSDIWHPVLERGDDPSEVKRYLTRD